MVEGDDNRVGIMQDCVDIHYDNQNVIHLADNQIYHERTKHINITHALHERNC